MKPETPTDARILAQGAVVTSRRTKNRQLTNLSENARKSFRMTSLQKISQQLSWIDILTKKHGGWGPGCSEDGCGLDLQPVQYPFRWQIDCFERRGDVGCASK